MAEIAATRAVAEEAKRPAMPPAKSIFQVVAPAPAGAERPAGGDRARVGSLLGTATPAFTVLTSRGFPLTLKPEVMDTVLEGQLTQVPIGDCLLRQELVEKCPDAAQGCVGFWPHLQGKVKYCSFRNPRVNPSVHGGDAVCSVETQGGRRKVGPKELIAMQKAMRMDIVAAPTEEVPLDTAGARRVQRAVVRGGDWLKEILEAKASDEALGFDWHVLAGIQGCHDLKLRRKACENAALLPIAGFYIGGLGYAEDLVERAKVLEAISAAAPVDLPRFLPLNVGSPVEVLQAVLLGVDVLEVTYPTQAGSAGIALTFDWDMPEDFSLDDAAVEEVLAPLVSVQEGAKPCGPVRDVKQLELKEAQFKEDFGPISTESPVRQYSRAYICHLLEVRELLAYMLCTQHNLDTYRRFFEAIRQHIKQGTLRKYAAWFMKTQTCEPKERTVTAPPTKRKRT